MLNDTPCKQQTHRLGTSGKHQAAETTAKTLPDHRRSPIHASRSDMPEVSRQANRQEGSGDKDSSVRSPPVDINHTPAACDSLIFVSDTSSENKIPNVSSSWSLVMMNKRKMNQQNNRVKQSCFSDCKCSSRREKGSAD